MTRLRQKHKNLKKQYELLKAWGSISLPPVTVSHSTPPVKIGWEMPIPPSLEQDFESSLPISWMIIDKIAAGEFAKKILESQCLLKRYNRIGRYVEYQLRIVQPPEEEREWFDTVLDAGGLK
jgi:hypothetical protein